MMEEKWMEEYLDQFEAEPLPSAKEEQLLTLALEAIQNQRDRHGAKNLGLRFRSWKALAVALLVGLFLIKAYIHHMEQEIFQQTHHALTLKQNPLFKTSIQEKHLALHYMAMQQQKIKFHRSFFKKENKP